MIKSGAAAPSFELRDLEGGSHSIDQILAGGTPAVLAFFKVSCPVCQLAFPFLERMARGGKVRFFGVSQDDASATRKFQERFGVTFPMLLDESRKGYPASNAFGITNVPSLFLIEPDRGVAAAVSGFSKRDLEAIGERAGKPPFLSGESVPEWKAG